jgi:RNA polymerase-binding transcription factor DksA
MAMNRQLHDRIKAVAAELRRELWGPKGYPEWGTKFTVMEEETADVGDALACELLSQGLRQQAEVEGHTAGKCSGCGEPIPLEEIAGRLLQAKRGEAVWQESYGRCQRCRKAFFPSVSGLGDRSR